MQPPADAGRRRAVWFFRLAAGLAVFWIAFRDVDPAAIGRAFRLADPLWLAASVVSVFATVTLVTLRWSALLGRPTPGRHATLLFSAVIASQVANILMPFKLGDAVRIGAVSRALDLEPAEVLGSIAVERLLDASLLVLTAGALVAAGSLPPFAHAGMLSLAIALGAAVLAAVVCVRQRRALLKFPLPAWLARQLDLLLRGLQRAAGSGVLLAGLLLSAGVMAGSILTAWLVLQALDIGAPAVSAAVVVIAVQIGSVVIPVPGGVGVSQVLTVQALGLWGIDEAPALAYALMLYLVSRVPKAAILPFALSALTSRKAGRA